MNDYYRISLLFGIYFILFGIPAIIGFNCAYKNSAYIVNNTFEYEYIKINCSVISQITNFTSEFNTYEYLNCVVNNTVTSCNTLYNSIKSQNISSAGLCKSLGKYMCNYEYNYFVSSYTHIITYIVKQYLKTQYKNEIYYYNLTYYTTNITEYNTIIANYMNVELYLYNNTLQYYSPNVTTREYYFTRNELYNGTECDKADGILLYILICGILYSPFICTGPCHNGKKWPIYLFLGIFSICITVTLGAILDKINKQIVKEHYKYNVSPTKTDNMYVHNPETFNMFSSDIFIILITVSILIIVILAINGYMKDYIKNDIKSRPNIVKYISNDSVV